MAGTAAAKARIGVWHWLLLLPIYAGATWLHIWYGDRHGLFDLHIYWRAARWSIHGHDVYTYSQRDPVEGSLGFTYPPFAALFLRPLGYLPLGGAQAVFCTFSVLTLIVTLWVLMRPVAARLGYPTWYAVAFVAPFVSWLEPVRETYTFGQINFILTMLVVLDLLVLVPRRSRFAGVLIGLAAAIKLTPAIFIVYLVLTRRWRAAVGAVVGAVAACAAGVLATGWRPSWHFWTSLLWQTGRVGRVDRVQDQSLNGLLARLARPHDPAPWVLIVLTVVVLAYGLWRARVAALAGDETTGLTLTGFVGALVSPLTWTHHLQWFVPALIVLLNVVTNPAYPKVRRRAYGAMGVVIYATVACSVVTWYDWGFVSKADDKGVPGFLIDNWYLLLIVTLLIFLPVRGGTEAASPAGPDVAGEREAVASDAR